MLGFAKKTGKISRGGMEVRTSYTVCKTKVPEVNSDFGDVVVIHDCSADWRGR